MSTEASQPLLRLLPTYNIQRHRSSLLSKLCHFLTLVNGGPLHGQGNVGAVGSQLGQTSVESADSGRQRHLLVTIVIMMDQDRYCFQL